jgi:hypothetical protein
MPVAIWLLISPVFPSRMQFESAVEPSRISNAGARPDGFRRKQLLGDHAAQHLGEHDAHLLLPPRPGTRR